jgi:hypothetical protein
VSSFGKYHLEFLKQLEQNKVKFLVVGGQAAIYYGVRRATGDLDLLIQPTKENGRRLLAAFQQLNLQVDEIKPEEFEQSIFLGLGLEPDAVDIFTTTPGIDFESAYSRSNEMSDSGLSIKLISLQDLLKNKEALNRGGEKQILDQYDVAVLKKLLKRP